MDNMSDKKSQKKGVGLMLDLAKPEDQAIYKMIQDKRASLGYKLAESIILKLLLVELKNLRKKLDTGGDTG